MANIQGEKEKIVIYKGDSRYDTMCVFADELGKAFERLGYQAVMINVNDESDTNQKINMLFGMEVKAFIGFNGVGCTVQLNDGTYLQDVMSGPYYGFFVDHPVYQYDRMVTPVKNMNAFVVDESHVDYIQSHHPNIRTAQMIPHGGIKRTDIQPFKNRKNGIVFFGSYANPEKTLNQIDTLGNQGLTDIIYNVIEHMLTDFNVTIDMAFDEILRKNNLTISQEEYHSFMTYVRLADSYVRHYFRQLIIKTIVEAGIQVEVYGQGWNEFHCNADENLIIHEPVSYLEAYDIMDDTKIVLNVMPWFKKGSHERIFMAMLSGAVCVTDTSTYIDRMFTDTIDIVKYSLNGISGLPMKLKKILEDDVYAETIAAAGYKNAYNNHTWDNRAEDIIRWVEYNTIEQYITEMSDFSEIIKKSKENRLYYNRFQQFFKRLEQIFRNLTYIEKEKLISVLEERQEANPMAQLALQSFAMKYFKEPEYTRKLIETVCDKEKFPWNIRLCIYWYIIQFAFTKGNIMDAAANKQLREMYADIVGEIKKECGIHYEFREKERRNSKKVIVLISQFLTMEHAPTKTVLDRCRCLIEDYGMEVSLINTAEFMYIDKIVCLYDMAQASYDDSLSGIDRVEYMGHQIPYYQCSANMPCVEEILRLAEVFYDMNPYFILNIGGNSPVADICSEFCPTLTIATVYSSMATTLGQFQAIGRQLTETEKSGLKDDGKLGNHVIESNFTFSLKPQKTKLTRQQLGLPEDKFVLILVGARMTEELDGELLNLLIAETDSNTVIALAGGYDNYDKKAQEIDGFTQKIFNLGFQKDMLAVLDCCDLYINPKRMGGGTSVFEAMYKGLPVVTLPIGDVGLAAGREFHAAGYDEMLKNIQRYAADKEYYGKQSVKAKERAAELMDTSKEFGIIIDEMIKRME